MHIEASPGFNAAVVIPFSNLICDVYRRKLGDHTSKDHRIVLFSFQDPPEWPPAMTTALRNWADRLQAGEYDIPIPPPGERRRIRQGAGWTQQDVADEIFDRADRIGVTDVKVDRWSVGRFERPAGYVNGKRLRGQEPTGELRRLYAQILSELEGESS